MKHTIATTSIDGYSYDDYLEYCEGNRMTPAEDGSSVFYEWCHEEAEVSFSEDMANIEEFYDEPVIVRGTLGLWDGRHEIVPTRKESVYDAIKDCYSGCEDLDVEWDNGVIVVSAYHHDGCNVFEITAEDGGPLKYLYS